MKSSTSQTANNEFLKVWVQGGNEPGLPRLASSVSPLYLQNVMGFLPKTPTTICFDGLTVYRWASTGHLGQAYGGCSHALAVKLGECRLRPQKKHHDIGMTFELSSQLPPKSLSVRFHGITAADGGPCPQVVDQPSRQIPLLYRYSISYYREPWTAKQDVVAGQPSHMIIETIINTVGEACVGRGEGQRAVHASGVLTA